MKRHSRDTIYGCRFFAVVVCVSACSWRPAAGTTIDGNTGQSGLATETLGSAAFSSSATVTDPGGPLPSDVTDFGPNVLIFDASMPMQTIQSKIDAIYEAQETDQFGPNRYAYFFKPGQYQLDVQVGYYMTVLGLGQTPDDVQISGGVRTLAGWNNGNATVNFWRGVENLAVTPQQDGATMIWAVAQATSLRRLHIKGPIDLWDPYFQVAWSSGGFIANTKVDTRITSGSQQQFIVRNSAMGNWQGGVWNMVFVGNEQTPSPSWPAPPYTIVDKTPVVREKPFLTFDAVKGYAVVVPPVKQNSVGISWNAGGDNSDAQGTTLGLDQFYVAHANQDTAQTLSIALQRGKNLILTPGIYHLSQAIQVNRAGSIILGLGMATLTPDNGTSVIDVADVDGVSITGLILDAGVHTSPTMVTLGPSGSTADHSHNPTMLFDVSCRVGGATAGATKNCVTINQSNAILDNVWLWRADHGAGAGWAVNPAANGLIVNADDVSAYGLFVEHFQEYQTLWSGNGGRVYFYQSEIPYDVPDQASWTHDSQNGYASYRVADSVTSHQAQGMGIYCVFNNPVVLDNAIQTPVSANISMHHMVTQWLGVAPGSAINHIINDTGSAVTSAQNMSSYSAD